jgi:hypothetical protein
VFSGETHEFKHDDITIRLEEDQLQDAQYTAEQVKDWLNIINGEGTGAGSINPILATIGNRDASDPRDRGDLSPCQPLGSASLNEHPLGARPRRAWTLAPVVGGTPDRRAPCRQFRRVRAFGQPADPQAFPLTSIPSGGKAALRTFDHIAYPQPEILSKRSSLTTLRPSSSRRTSVVAASRREQVVLPFRKSLAAAERHTGRRDHRVHW